MATSRGTNFATNPRTGFWSLVRIVSKIKDPKVRRAVASTVLRSAEHQIHREPRDFRRDHFSTRAKYPLHSVQGDLADFSNHNDRSAKYLFFLIDVASRKLWLYPLPNKKQGTVNAAMRAFLKSNRGVKNYTSDPGSEFLSLSFRKILTENHVTQWMAPVGSKNRTGVVERSIRTIRNLIRRWEEHSGSTKFSKVLKDLVWNYNLQLTRHCPNCQRMYFRGKRVASRN